MLEKPDAILIAGPTASGKSALALRIARETGGAVINADAMQVYGVLDVLTARPRPEEMAGIGHRLYGHVHPGEAHSVARWLDEARAAVADLRSQGLVPVFAGGTGLYFKALTDGISDIPAIDPEVRARIREAVNHDPRAMHAILERLDPVSADRIKPGDSQRIARALEVRESTGRPLSFWLAADRGGSAAIGTNLLKIVLAPPRPALNERIATRFRAMLDAGAMAEVAELMELGIAESMPAMRAIGVRQLARVLSGELSLEEASGLAVIATRQYAKRQMTWFRNQFCGDWQWIESGEDLPPIHRAS